MRGRASSPASMTPEPGFLPATGGKRQGGRREYLSLFHSTAEGVSGRTHSPTLLDTIVYPGDSPGQDPTMVPGGITGYSHQAAPHYPRVSSSASLHCACILLFLFLFHFSTTFLLLLVVPVSGDTSGVFSGVLCPAHILWCWAGVISGMVCTPNSRSEGTRLTGGYLRLPLCLGPRMPVWWSSQACSSPSTWLTPFKGRLCQAHFCPGLVVLGEVLLVSGLLLLSPA